MKLWSKFNLCAFQPFPGGIYRFLNESFPVKGILIHLFKSKTSDSIHCITVVHSNIPMLKMGKWFKSCFDENKISTLSDLSCANEHKPNSKIDVRSEYSRISAYKMLCLSLAQQNIDFNALALIITHKNNWWLSFGAFKTRLNAIHILSLDFCNKFIEYLWNSQRNWFILNGFLLQCVLEASSVAAKNRDRPKWFSRIRIVLLLLLFAASPHYMLNDFISLIRPQCFSVDSITIARPSTSRTSLFRAARRKRTRKKEEYKNWREKRAQIGSSLSSWQMVAFDR